MSRKHKWQDQKIEFACSSLELQAADVESGKPPSFNMVAYNGGELDLGNFPHPTVIDATGVTFHGNGSSPQPILRDHDTSRPIGHGTPTVEAGQLHVSGTISQVTADATEIIAAAKNGFDWQASVGGKMTKPPVFVKAGKSVNVNGREIQGPIYLVSGFRWVETSVVAIGADAERASTSIAATLPKGKTMKNDLKDFVLEAGFDPDDLEESQIEFFQAQYDAKVEASNQAERQLLDQEESKEQAEQQRVDDINHLTAQALAGNPQNVEAVKALCELAINARWDKDKFELELIRGTRATTSTTPNRSKNRQGVSSEIVEASICMTNGLQQVDKHYSDQTLDAVDKNYRNGIGLKQLIYVAAQANGYTGSAGGEVTPEVMRYAFAEQSGIAATSGFSTVSLPNVLSNVANKFVRQGFNSVESAWRSVGAIRSVRDFKQITTNSLVGDYTLEETSATGEISHGKPGEVSYTNQASEHARMIGISRRDIINDDTSALSAVPQKLGRGGALAINTVFWTTFLNNSSFFASGNSNVSTGAGSALTATGSAVNVAEQKFYDQTDPDGSPLGVMPAIMLVPTLLHNTALQVVNSSLITGQGADAAPVANTNVYQGRYQVVTSTYMSNALFTGYSSAAWYLLANPADMPVIETVFLNGRDTPVVESAEASFNTLGIQMRAYGDFGCALQEYRGGVRSAGS